MQSNKSQPIGQIQLPQCHICNLQPIPESVQFVPFIMLQILLVFISLELAGIVLLGSYCYSRNAWFCPQCKRQIQIGRDVEGISQNLIIRMGNCMFMLSKFKFRIVAVIIIVYLFYLFAIEIHQKPKLNIEKTWLSLSTNCGYEPFLENSYKANTLYAQYPQLGEWTISGIYLRQQQVSNKVKKILIKMNPSQFKNPLTEDVAIVVTPHTAIKKENIQLGDVIEIRGQWEGREAQGHLFRFGAMKVEKTGTRQSPTDVKLLSVAERFIRIHEEEKESFISKEDHQRLVNQKIKNITVNN